MIEPGVLAFDGVVYGVDPLGVATQGIIFEQSVIDLARGIVERRIRGGRSPRHQVSYNIKIGTKILLINGIEPPNPIKGYVFVEFDPLVRPKVKIVECSSECVQNKLVIAVRKTSVKHG